MIKAIPHNKVTQYLFLNIILHICGEPSNMQRRLIINLTQGLVQVLRLTYLIETRRALIGQFIGAGQLVTSAQVLVKLILTDIIHHRKHISSRVELFSDRREVKPSDSIDSDKLKNQGAECGNVSILLNEKQTYSKPLVTSNS